MIDLSKIKYRVSVIDENGNQFNISDYIENLGWEENENEISVRSSFTVMNDNTSKGYLSGIVKPGCLIGIFAIGDSINEEVARGYVETWNNVEQGGGQTLKSTNYDELFKLQKSQDNRFYAAGTGTQSAVQGILDDWQIPQGEYSGPNISHEKQVFNNRYLSDIILELLDDARKKGSDKCIIRASKGYTSIIPRGSNKTVYVFQKNNSKQFSHTISTDGLITRVKVVGQADDEGNTSVEAVLNGFTQYGIRQKIYTRDSDATQDEANQAAQKILNDEGKITKEMSVSSPDVPFIRKGDLVYLICGSDSNYYYVKGIQHDCDTFSMTMSLELAETEVVQSTSQPAAKDYNVGDIVDFHGGTHYVSSYSDSKGYKARAGKAKITIKNGRGKAHPWHLIHIDSGSNVYGWVDDGTFS